MIKNLIESILKPDSEFTPIPFWFLNDELTDEEMKKLVDFLNTEVESNMNTKFVTKLSNYEILCCNWDLIYSDDCYETIGYMPNYLEM